MSQFKAGDRVHVAKLGVDTTVLREMPEGDYEVDLTDEQQHQGISPFFASGQLQLVEAAPAPKSTK